MTIDTNTVAFLKSRVIDTERLTLSDLFMLFVSHSNKSIIILYFMQNLFYLPQISVRRKSILLGPLSYRDYDNKKFTQIIFPQRAENYKEKKKVIFMMNSTMNNQTEIIKSRLQQTSYKKSTSQIKKKPQKILPLVNIYLTDMIYAFQNVKSKTIVLDLEKYFQVYFRKSLKGELTRDFYHKVDKYIKEMLQKNILNLEVDDFSHPNDMIPIQDKEQFLQVLSQLEKKRDFKSIYQMIKFYCIPSREYRRQTIKDIKFFLKKQLKQNYEYVKDTTDFELITMHQSRNVITDLIQISFNTTSLMFCQKKTMEESAHRFFEAYETKMAKHKKQQFLNSLKQTFRQRIKKIDQNQKPIQYNMSSRTAKVLEQRSPEKLTSKKSKQQRNSKEKQREDILKHFHSIFGVKKQTIDKIYTEFQELFAYNDKIQAHFTLHYENQGLLLKENFLKNCQYINTKKPIIQQKILDCLDMLNPYGFIPVQKYIQFRLLIDCQLEKHDIVTFLSRYLRMDETLEIRKVDLARELHTSLEQYDSSNATKVIVDTIWVWMKRNYFIEFVGEDEEVLHMRSFKERFVGNEIIYYFLLSIIFQTNEVSPLEVAYQILI